MEISKPKKIDEWDHIEGTSVRAENSPQTAKDKTDRDLSHIAARK